MESDSGLYCVFRTTSISPVYQKRVNLTLLQLKKVKGGSYLKIKPFLLFSAKTAPCLAKYGSVLSDT